jgi:RNA polymerase sigma-70 factor (ECF subfamily)
VADTTVGFAIDSCVEQAPPADPVWLLEGLRTGDENAYEALVSRYQQPVYNLIYRLMDDPADASDVVQEVFLKVFRNVGSFRGNSSLKTWIYRIAVNEAHNHRRWFARHRRKEVGLEGEEEGVRQLQDVLCDPGRSPYDLAAGSETRALVEDALTVVNPVFRAAVILRDMEDMSYEEVAEVLQVSIGTVKSRILRGREALRKTLAGRLEPGPEFSWKAQTAE